jgi:hypothetical protein
MAIETLLQPLLIEVVSNETNASAQHEKTIKESMIEIIIGLLSIERSTMSQQIHKTAT